MSDFGMFESDEAASHEPRLAAKTAARKLEAAIDVVRRDFGRFLLGATGIDEFGDRWHYSKADIRAAIEPYVFPNTGTMRRVHNAMKQDWKLAHPYKVAGGIDVSTLDPTSSAASLRHRDDKANNRFTMQKPYGIDTPGNQRVLTNHDDTELMSADGQHHWASRHYAEDRDAPIQDIDETYHPSSDNLIPDGDFHGYEDSVDQGGPEKVQRDFGSGGDTGSDRHARRRQAGEEGGLLRFAPGEVSLDDLYSGEARNRDFADEEGGLRHFAPGEVSLNDLYSGEGRATHREAARLVADIYTDFARANGMRVASLDTLDRYAATGLAPADYDLLARMIVAACECDDDDEDDSDSEGGSEAPSASESDDSEDDDDSGEAPDFGGESGAEDDSDDDDESDADADGDHDDDDHHVGDEGGEDDYGFGGGDEGGAAGQTFTVPEHAPELDPQLMQEIPQDDQGGSAPIPPEVVDSLLGLPEGTIEQLLLEEAQGQGLGGGEPQGGGDDFFGGGGDEPEPPRTARRFWAAPDEGEAELMGRQRQQQRDAIDTKFGPAPQRKPDIQDLYRRAQSGDPQAYALLKGLWDDRGWKASARLFWAADDDSESSSNSSGGGGDSSGGGGGQQAPAQPQQDPNAMMGGGQPPMDPTAMGGMQQPMLPPPGSQAVQPPAPAMPLENQPAEDALLDTANQAIMQMIDRETQEYQQIIDPLSQALQAIQFAQSVEQSEHPMDVTPPQGTVDVSPAAAPGGAANPMQPTAARQFWAAEESGCYHPRSCQACDRAGKACGAHDHDDCSGGGKRQAKIRTALRGAARVIAQKYRLSATGERMLLEAMGRRQYEHVREALSLVPPEVRRAAGLHMGEMFAAENPRFNKDVWMKSVLAGTARERYQDKAYSGPRDKRRDEHGQQDLLDMEPGWYQQPHPGYGSPEEEQRARNRLNGEGYYASRGRLPFESTRRTAGETWTNTPTQDAFEFPNAGQTPRVDDGIAVNNLPKMTGADPHAKNASVRHGKDILKKLQNWLSQQQARGLNYGGDVAAEGFLSQHPKAGPRATQMVHQTVGAPAHPEVEPSAPKVKTPKAINPVTKKGGRQASFFTRKVPGWRWDDHMNGYLSKEGRAFTCSCGEPVAAPSYKNCRCGKIWNVYAIGDTHHLGSDTADMFIAREIPVRPGVVMANRKLAGDGMSWEDTLRHIDDALAHGEHDVRRCEECGAPKLHQVVADDASSDEGDHHAEWCSLHPRNIITARAQKSHRELLAEIERLADWTKYDGPDPAREGGPKKPPSTTIPKQPRDWAKRSPEGTWQGPAIPRKKK